MLDRRLAWRLAAALHMWGAMTAHAAPASHDLMPAPSSLEWGSGAMTIDASFRFATSGPEDARVSGALARLGVWLQKEAGLAKVPAVVSGGKESLRVVWTTVGRPVQSVDEEESYTLWVARGGAQLTAENPLGILRGLETFRQLVQTEAGVTRARAAAVNDVPRFPWRGLLIDPSRRWQPVENIQRTLDGMAAVKMNVLHWHLSEDQGFRLESPKYPGLHEKGSDGLFYTQEQVKDVIAYARARGIRVVPEFDMPGHTTSWLVAYPELASAPGPFEIVRRWGILDNSFDPTSEKVYAFVDGFLEAIAALFPDDYVHIGGDEVTPKRWNENAAIQEFAYKNGLRDAHDLQAYFNKRVNEILTRHQKKMVGWDEILHPDLPKTIVVQSWRGAAALDKAAREGYDGILSNGYYLDLMESTARHYAVDPLPASSTLDAEARRHVLGGEACLWGEYVSAEMLDARLWPRAAAIAERLWSPADVRDVDDMYRRLERQSVRLDGLGLTHRSSYRVMLQRLVGDRAVEPLMVLADVVEPVKGYRRSGSRTYTQQTPLTRFVDAVRPESAAARAFRKDVDAWIAGGDGAALKQTLARWADHHVALATAVADAPDSATIRNLSRDLAALGVLGKEAVALLDEKRGPVAGWTATARDLLDGAARPRVEVEMAVVPAMRRLVVAASQPDALRDLPRAEWNAWLDSELTPRAAPVEHD